MGSTCHWLGLVDTEGVLLSWQYGTDSFTNQQVFDQMEFHQEKESLRIVQLKHGHVLISVRPSPTCPIVFAVIGHQQVFELESFLRNCLIPAMLHVVNEKQHMDRAQVLAHQTKLRLLVSELVLQGRIQHTNFDAAMRQYKMANAIAV